MEKETKKTVINALTLNYSQITHLLNHNPDTEPTGSGFQFSNIFRVWASLFPKNVPPKSGASLARAGHAQLHLHIPLQHEAYMKNASVASV